MKSLIWHIPHSSVEIPARYRDQFVLSDAAMENELLRMTDHFTAELFQAEGRVDLVFPVSRLLVDVERFEDDSREVMATRGMGALYASTHDRKPLRRALRIEERDELMTRFYRPHHRNLEELVDRALEAYGHALIIDCHSFPSQRLPYERSQDAWRPEICIGTDDFHTPGALRDAALEGFAQAGFSVAQNTPFAGALTPLKHYGRDQRVTALMIEVRRDLYMDEECGERSVHFESIRNRIQKVMRPIELRTGDLVS